MMKLSFFTTAIFGLVTVTKVVSSDVEGHLRGGDAHIDSSIVEESLERDLQLSIGGTSRSLKFTFASPSGSNKWCFNYYDTCKTWGDISMRTHADSDLYDGFAIAESYESLWLEATCLTYAEAYARTCSFTKIEGSVDVTTKTVNKEKTVAMEVKLQTATTTIAVAASVAAALAYAEAGAYSYTDIPAFCEKVKGKSIVCGAGSTDLTQVAVAAAGAIGQASSVAATGTKTQTTAAVQASGTGINTIESVITATAKTWTFVSASASAAAIASAFTAVYNESFLEICIKEHERRCGGDTSKGGACADGPDVACATAYAKGEAFAQSVSLACAEAFASAFTQTIVYAGISANVDCKSTPIFAWKCANAYTDVSCGGD